MPPIKLVCFDLGGVLIQINRTWQDAAAQADVDVHLSSHVPVPLTEVEIFNQFQAGTVSELDYHEGLAKAIGCKPEEAVRVHLGILKDPYPGTLQLIRNLEDMGIRTGCLTNTNASHWNLMRTEVKCPNIARLQVAVASHEAKVEKPKPESYAHFENKSGLHGEDIAFFDDTFENVVAAQNHGWRAAHIDFNGDTAAQMREHLSNWLL